MPVRSWIAVLLLINYLLVAGMGCMSRPEDQRELMLVKTDVAGPYQECRYVRMDGLNELLNEALASRYQSAPDTAKQQLISVVHGVDAHHLPRLTGWLSTAMYRVVDTLLAGPQPAISLGTDRAIYSPPKVGYFPSPHCRNWY